MIETLPITATAADSPSRSGNIRYSICTLVSNPTQYATMIRSFEAGGFKAPDCEYLYLDNTGSNRFDGYAGLNVFLRVSKGAYIILCHQDVELIQDDATKLDAVIGELDSIDPAWGLFGNAGGQESGRLAVRISDPFGKNQSVGGGFPTPAVSLDENFIVVKGSANLAVSSDLAGFHFYGTELCLVADRLGWRAYIVDFHLLHHGRGTMDSQFFAGRSALITKCNLACRSRWMTTTCTAFPIVSSVFLQRLATSTRGNLAVKFMMKLRRWVAVVLCLAPRHSQSSLGSKNDARRNHFGAVKTS